MSPIIPIPSPVHVGQHFVSEDHLVVVLTFNTFCGDADTLDRTEEH